MTKERRRFQLYILRAPLSFFIALVLFFVAPMQVKAANVWGSGLNLEYPPVVFDNIPRVDSINNSVSFSGLANFPIYISCSTSRPYAAGVVVIPFTTTFSTFPGTTAPYSYSIAIDSVSLPEGFSASLVGDTSIIAGNTITSNLCIYFPMYDFRFGPRLSITLRFEYSTFDNNASKAPASNFNFKPGVATHYYHSYDHYYELSGFQADVRSYLLSVITRLDNIHTAITTQTDQIRNSLDVVNNSINKQGKNITDKLQSQINNDNSNTTKITNAINAASKAEIDAANKNSQAEINAADKNANDIMHDYDTTNQDADNQKFADSQKELQEVEDNLFGQAVSGFDALDMSNYNISHLTTVLPAFSFVSGFLQSLYVNMGDFGVVVTVGLVVMIASKVIGLYRFSTGGDSS